MQYIFKIIVLILTHVHLKSVGQNVPKDIDFMSIVIISKSVADGVVLPAFGQQLGKWTPYDQEVSDSRVVNCFEIHMIENRLGSAKEVFEW
jgi:hypothetical protein